MMRRCKACNRIEQKKWRDKNPELSKQRVLDSYHKHIDKRLAYQREYHRRKKENAMTE